MVGSAKTDPLFEVSARLGDAAVDPSVWPELMESICAALRTTGAVLLQTDIRTSDVPRTKSCDEVMRAYFEGSWAPRDPRVRGVPRMLTGEVITEEDFLTPDQMRRDPMYNELVLPFKFKWFAGVGFWAGEAFWALSMQRLQREGAFSVEDKRLLARLAPRLTETATLSTAVGRAVLSGITDVLDRVRQPAVVLHRLGCVLGTNAAAEDGFDDDIRVKDRHLAIWDKEAAAKLDRIVRLMRFVPDTASLPAEPIVARRRKKPPLLIRILPIDGAARNVFLGARALLILTNLTPPQPPEPRALAQAFGLTQAEARVASLLVEGRSVSSIAEKLSVTPNTVRMQLKAVFAKTNTRRQGELIALLTQLTTR
jgi:DNA-binding CsgD family transcriptional regulator